MLFNINSKLLITASLIILIILFFAFLYFTEIDLPVLNWMSDLIYNIITPILNLVHQVIESVQNFFITLFSIDEVNQEIKTLRQKNSVLERQILFLENINSENERLRELLNFKEKVDYKMIGAEVIAKSPSVWEKTITINRGSKDGLKKRMPVISYQGHLVGRVENIGISSAQVRLITDRDFIVGGIIARNSSRAIGLVKGRGRRDKPNLMDSISWNAEIEIGDLVLTSGLSNNFPAGLKIGEVDKIETDNYGLSQKADINLLINRITLEEVMVIKKFKYDNNNQKEEIEKTEIKSDEESEKNNGHSEKEKN